MSDRLSDRSSSGKTIRPSSIEGIFYPADPQLLSARVEELLAAAAGTEKLPGQPYALIVPHAAFDYAGEVAAAAYRAVRHRAVETVVLLGPVHREPAAAVILPESQMFQTPLGPVPTDARLLAELSGRAGGFVVDDIPHLEEHCLEAQLPFVQHLFPGAAIVPLLLGKPTGALVHVLAEALWELIRGRLDSTLLVVTTNLGSGTDRRTGRREAERVLQWILDGRWQPLLEAAESGRLSSCGAGCVAAILQVHSRMAGALALLREGSSLPVMKDPDKVLYYAAVVMTTDGVRDNGVHTQPRRKGEPSPHRT